MKKILFFATLILALCVVTDVEAKKKKFKNGDVYEGEIVKGVLEGVGVMTYANGDVYSGSWRDGEKVGKGVMKYANGDIYNGEWSLGFHGGIGEMKYTNGNIYHGTWSCGVPKNGEMTYSNGYRYNCFWIDGKIDESKEVIIIYPNHHLYKGYIKNGLRNGQGAYYHSSASKDLDYKSGYWEEDKFISGVSNTTKFSDRNMPNHISYIEEKYFLGKAVSGTITYNTKSAITSSIIYKGEMSNYKRNGQGVLSIDGTTISGVWSDDTIEHGSGSTEYLGEKYDFDVISSDAIAALATYTYSDNTTIQFNVNFIELSICGKLIKEDIDKKEKKRIEEEKKRIEEEKKRIEEEKKRKAEEKIRQAKANAKYYVWKDSELASINKTNPAKLKTMLGDEDIIIQGVVQNIREYEQMEDVNPFKAMKEAIEFTNPYGYTPMYKNVKFYIIQLNGIAIRSESDYAVSMLNVGEYVYVDAYYKGETFFSDEYPLFRGGLHSSLNSAVNRILEYKKNQLDDYIRCPYRK